MTCTCNRSWKEFSLGHKLDSKIIGCNLSNVNVGKLYTRFTKLDADLYKILITLVFLIGMKFASMMLLPNLSGDRPGGSKCLSNCTSHYPHVFSRW